MERITINLSAQDEQNVKLALERKLKVDNKRIKYFNVVKKSLDARRKNDIKFVYTVDYSFIEEKTVEQKVDRITKPLKVLVVGSGPCGLFCAMQLLRSGASVTVIERGKEVNDRAKDYAEFIKTRKLNTESNLQFGEGGAGTFSDGKLNTGTGSELIKLVLSDFVKFGAPSEILYDNKPHIGSDRLSETISNMRKEIIRLGGEVYFSTKLEDIKIEDGKVVEVKTSVGDRFDEIVLAIGHSARDTFEMLKKRGVTMESKAFAVGFRIEHKQEWLDIAQYGRARNGNLPVADYKLVSHAGNRSVFSFCMCPGGTVMAAASEEWGVVTNGASNYLRDGENCNSAIIAEIRREDFSSDDALSGMYFQRQLERAAFIAGGGDYSAPVQKLGDYIKGKESKSLGSIKCTYVPQNTLYPLYRLLTNDINESIRASVFDMDRRLKGFNCPDAVMVGIESRTSSPIRILRNDNLQSLSAENLYPGGEGAGYAGGITSAAVDGIKIANALIEKYK